MVKIGDSLEGGEVRASDLVHSLIVPLLCGVGRTRALHHPSSLTGEVSEQPI